MWILQIGGWQGRITVLPANRPALRGTYDSASQEFRLLLSGFQPSERIVLVTSNATGSGFSVTTQQDAMTEVAGFDGSIRVQIDPSIITSLAASLEFNTADLSGGTATLDMTELSVIRPERVVPTLDTYDRSQLSLVLFDQLELADLSVIDQLDLDSDSGYTGGVFGMTLSGFDGAEMQADLGGYVVGTFSLPGNPIAAVGESGSMAIWPNLAQLSTLDSPGDAEALRAAVYESYWGGTPSESVMPCSHVVASGDTLNKIASAYGITLQQLLDANPQISNPDVIHRGDMITLPDCT
jgi:hypothetical protein